jgi:type VI secretion system protein ImpI/type VI secretion system protein
MTLTLTMLRCPDRVAPETRKLAGGEFSIGRGGDSDWVLPDPELSRRHCLLSYRSGGWQIADFSANGTFLNRESEPIGRGQSRDLRDGDRLRFGEYEIEVRIVETTAAGYAPAHRNDAFALDPFATGPIEQNALFRRDPEQDALGPALAPPSISLPEDYNPLAPEPAEAPFVGPTQPDHSPHLEDAFSAPIAHPVLPEDWDKELLSQSAAATPGAAAAPVLTAPPEAPAAPGPAPAPPPPAPPSPPLEDLLGAFLRGVGFGDTRPADPAAVMEALGAAFRALVSGLRQAMIARAAIKREFRIEPTQIRARGNNPLKFSANDDDALAALLGLGRRTEMGAEEAVSQALRDIRLHELATVSAMQSAVRAILAEFDPPKLRMSVERGGLDIVPMQKKAHAWDAFAAHYARLTRALADDFDSVYGKAFARAYEKALAEAAAREDSDGEPRR